MEAGGATVKEIVGACLMAITAVAGFVSADAGAAEEAVIATTPPGGTEDGAVYVVLTV